MAEATLLDFQQLLSQPTLAYEEGLRFFRGVSLMNETLKRLAKDLDGRQIAYSIIEAVALNQHGYHRFTHDIDVLMTREGLKKFTEELIGRGYRPAFEGATKTFRATAENVPIEIITTAFHARGAPFRMKKPSPLSHTWERGRG
jgi:hypothetical protein